MIDDEFSTVMSAEGDDVRKGPSGICASASSSASRPAKGRFGATPSFSLACRRASSSTLPATSDAERLSTPSVGHQLVPDWQIADAARKAQKAAVRREQVRYHTQRIEAAAAARQAKAEATHDARMESLIQQNQRYLSSVANENRASLKVQRPSATWTAGARRASASRRRAGETRRYDADALFCYGRASVRVSAARSMESMKMSRTREQVSWQHRTRAQQQGSLRAVVCVRVARGRPSQRAARATREPERRAGLKATRPQRFLVIQTRSRKYNASR